MRIEYTNGTVTKVENEEEAIEILGDAVIADDWDSYGPFRSRKLVWETEEDSLNDAGSNAIAQIIR